MQKPRLLRVTTIPLSLKLLLRGQLGFIQSKGYEVVTVSANGTEVADITRLGIQHETVPFTRALTPLRDLWCLFLLIRIIRKFKPHIIHSHTPKAGLIAMMAGWICRTPVRIHTVAGLPEMEAIGWRKWLLRTTERLTVFFAHRIYPNSFGLKEYMTRELDVPAGRLTVLGKGSTNGIDTAFFSPSGKVEEEARLLRQRLGIGANEIVFCFVGRLVKDKGITELTDAFVSVTSEVPAKLLLVGPLENDRDPLPDRTLEVLQSRNDIVCAGYHDDVRPWMAASDIFVFPSYREGFPNVVLQACCMETPVIVSDINGCNEIISHAKSGWIVRPKDTTALADAMVLLAKDKPLRTGLASAAAAFVRSNFEQHVIWEELYREYQQLLFSRVPALR